MSSKRQVALPNTALLSVFCSYVVYVSAGRFALTGSVVAAAAYESLVSLK